MNDNNSSVVREAEAWLVRLRGDEAADDPALRAEFERWLAASPDHREAHEKVSRRFSKYEKMKNLDGYGSGGAEERLGSTRNYWLPLSAAAAAAIAAVLFYVSGSDPVTKNDDSQPKMASVQFEPLETMRGEIRSFKLDDGSVATLDTGSKIEVAMTSDARRLRLSQGKARLEVANDARPFTVEAGSGEIVTTMAKFDVGYQDGETVTVQLINGDAEIRPAAKFASFNYPAKRLAVGSMLSFGKDDFKVSQVASDANREEWPTGWVEYRSIRLDDLVAQVNAYAGKPIKIDDASIAGLKISGRFKIDDADGFVSRICQLFDLSARSDGSGIYLRRR